MNASSLLCGLALCASLCAGEPAIKDAEKRLPAPDAAKQKEAEKFIREIFTAEYAKTTPADRQALAQKLLQQGADTKDDMNARYVLLRDARDFAAQAGDCETALAAVAELAKTHEIDAFAEKLAVLAKADSAARTPDSIKVLAANIFAVLDETIAANNFEVAARLATQADAVARRAQNPALAARAQARVKDVRELQSEHARLKTVFKTLEEKPDDPDANLAAGKFACYIKGDWDAGLPLLAKGSDAALKTLAASDLANPTGHTEQLTIGDSWWDNAEKASEPSRGRIRAYAAFWYQKALPKLSGINAEKIKRRIEKAPLDVQPLRSVKIAASVAVKASAPQTDSGYKVETGKYYRLKASGSWAGADGKQFGPDGNKAANKRFWPWAPAALIGKVGSSEFPVSTGVIINAPESGTLFFKMHDEAGDAAKRTGVLRVSIEEIPPPRVSIQGGVTISSVHDSSDNLIIDKDGLRYEWQKAWRKVGLENTPVSINGVLWWPVWESDTLTKVYPLEGSAQLLAKKPTLKIIDGQRGKVTLVSYTADKLVLKVDDIGDGPGALSYELTP